jgi:hypothetical protein
MPITLAQAEINARADIDHAVIRNLRQYSWLWDQIVWDDTATPGTGGASLIYGYTLLKTPRSGQFRALNTEYSVDSAIREQKSVPLKPFGGAFSIDRVLRRLGPAQTNEVTFQMQELMTGATIRLQEEIINGDVAVDANGFDGLDKLLTGSTTEYVPNSGSTAYADWSPGAIDTQAKANIQLDIVDDWLSTIVPSRVGGGDLGAPGGLPAGRRAILGNTKSITRMRALARWAGQYTQTKDDLGRQIESYGPWTLVDLGDRAVSATPIIPIESRDADGGGAGGTITNLTDLYATTFGLDAFHGAAMAGKPLVETFMPDWTTPGAVKSGEIEIGPGAMVLRNTKSCGVLRNVKVA